MSGPGEHDHLSAPPAWGGQLPPPPPPNAGGYGRRQVRSSNGRQTGDSFGLAGMIIGALSFVGYVVLYAFVFTSGSSGFHFHIGT